MASTKVFDTITALLSTFDTALTIPVRDGPYLTRGSDPLFVVVGSDADPESVDAAAGSQSWSASGTRARDETGSITCVIVGQSGGSDLAGLRQTVEDAAEAISTALRTDPTLGNVVQSAGLGGSFDLKQETDPTAGLAVLLGFTVDYQARI
jgi:hypothetical protein